jgi:hypothetical protein
MCFFFYFNAIEGGTLAPPKLRAAASAGRALVVDFATLDVDQSATFRGALKDRHVRSCGRSGYHMSVGTALKLFGLALIVFAVAFGLRRTYFWDVTPVSWDQEPQSLWALGAAFLLRSLENIAAVVAGLTLVAAAALRLIRRRVA